MDRAWRCRRKPLPPDAFPQNQVAKKPGHGPVFLWPWMAGMPEMQEQFPAGAWTAPHPENEGTLVGPTCRKCRSNFRRVPGPHNILKRRHFGWTDMPKMQDAIFGGCVSAHDPKKRSPAAEMPRCGPEMQEQFPAGAWTAPHPENEGTLVGPTCRKCRSNFRMPLQRDGAESESAYSACQRFRTGAGFAQWQDGVRRSNGR